MKKILALSAFMVLALAGPALAQGQGRYADMDKNNDGAVVYEEFIVVFPDTDQAAFDDVDTDKDAKLSHDEWKAFMDTHGRPGGKHDGSGYKSGQGQGAGPGLGPKDGTGPRAKTGECPKN
ncbi:MAG: hypothetical protein JW718_11205 [Desulfovibrionaceae bacterium]|nr:hypothetical protein [Desulfovibrionaceae bacterium]